MAVSSWRAAGVNCAGECGDSGLEFSVDGDIASSTKFSSNCSFTLTEIGVEHMRMNELESNDTMNEFASWMEKHVQKLWSVYNGKIFLPEKSKSFWCFWLEFTYGPELNWIKSKLRFVLNFQWKPVLQAKQFFMLWLYIPVHASKINK